MISAFLSVAEDLRVASDNKWILITKRPSKAVDEGRKEKEKDRSDRVMYTCPFSFTYSATHLSPPDIGKIF